MLSWVDKFNANEELVLESLSRIRSYPTLPDIPTELYTPEGGLIPVVDWSTPVLTDRLAEAVMRVFEKDANCEVFTSCGVDMHGEHGGVARLVYFGSKQGFRSRDVLAKIARISRVEKVAFAGLASALVPCLVQFYAKLAGSKQASGLDKKEASL